MYQSSAEDKWRAFSTTKVIQAIKKHPKEITTYEVRVLSGDYIWGGGGNNFKDSKKDTTLQ